jgi:3-methyladenine DNA glycosylase/8-oxoguanine DNA glycosylase
MSVAQRSRKRAPLADRKAREFLRKADPVLGRVIDAYPGFRPRAWMDDLPPRDAFGTLIFQVVGQQLSVAATRTIVARIEERFGGRLPTAAEALAADPRCFERQVSPRGRARRYGRSRSDSSTDA